MVINGMIGLFFIITLFCMVSVKGEPYHLENQISQLTLTTGANLTIECKKQKNSSIKLTNETNIHDGTYKSLLHLTNVSILDVGYYCGPISANISENRKRFEIIYIFVQDDKYLLTNSVNNVYQNESGDVIIPCRPTSPNINVTIKKDNKLITENIHYDDKIGYTHWFFLQDTFQNVSCEANKNNFSEIKQFTIYKNPNATKIIISDGSLDHIYTGQNVTLECTVYTYPNKSFTIEWDFPDNLNKSGNIQVRTEKFSDFKHYKMGTKVLHIQNITVEDYGNFTCRVKFDSRGEKEMKYVPSKVISPESDYLNLKMINGKQNIVCRQGSKVEWEIQASSNQNVTFKWNAISYPDLLNKHPDKYFIETRNNTSKLEIKNIQTIDSREYVLLAFEDSRRIDKQMHVYIAVEVEPSIQLTEYFNLSTIYYEPNNVQSLDIKIIGNPLPKIHWFFQSYLRNCSVQSCPNEPIMIKDIKMLSEIELRLTIGINVTENGTLILTASNYLGNTTEKYEIVLTDIEILLNTSEHFLRSDSPIENRTLICKGNLPIQWHFKQYDESLVIKTNFSSNIFINDGATQLYLSILQLGKTNYLDTGYYYCSPLMADKKLITQKFKNIYIFVEDEERLFAIPSDINTWFFNENYDRYVIPCRPSSKDVKVEIKQINHGSILDENIYDDKVGYIMEFWSSFSSPTYSCIATKNDKREERIFTNFPRAVDIVRDGGDSNAVIEGQSLKLKCLANIPTTFQLDWKISDKLRNKTSHVDQPKMFNDQGSISLNIPNVTVEDHSEITCEFHGISVDVQHETSYLLNIINRDTSFLNLKIIEGQNLTIRPVGFRTQWTVQISANPRPYIEWIDQYGNNLEKISKTINVQGGNNILSVLVINDIQLLDSGNYTLTADNGNYTKEISFKLLVEDKPSIRPINLTYSKVLYDFGKKADFEFYVYGYPLPESVCTFQNCSNYPLCGSKKVQVIKQETINITDFSVKLSISMNVTETGELICSAKNKFGKSVEKYTILVTDIPEGFFVNRPSIILTGDTVIFECAVSIYNYYNRFKWAFSDDTSNHTEWNVSENKTQFSYHSYLMIQNISKKFNEYINCTVEKKIRLLMGSKTETKSISIKTEDPYKPKLIFPGSENSKAAGESVEFVCSVDGMPPPTISWSKVNGPSHLEENFYRMELQNQILTIKKLSLKDEGTYECNATNKFGSVVSTHTLTIAQCKWQDRYLIIIAFLVLIFSVAIITIIVMYSKITKEIKSKTLLCNESNLQSIIIGTIQNSSSKLEIEEQLNLLPYDKRLEFSSNKLKLGKTLSVGEFRVIYKAKAIDLIGENTTTTVAVKTVKDNVDLYHTNALIFELRTLIELGNHLNIVKFFGACIGCINKLMVIEEYCHFGNIHQYLRNQRNNFVDQLKKDDILIHGFETAPKTKPSSNGHLGSKRVDSDTSFNYNDRNYNNKNTNSLNTNDLIYWSYQIVKGMEYLAKMDVIHRNLKAKNILLAKGNVVKICNFRLAKMINDSEYHTEESDKVNLPFKWMAIECILDRVYSTQSDVWAFGIVLWEFFSLAMSPYPCIQIKDLTSMLVEGYRMEMPKLASFEIYQIMLACWNAEPMKRPSFTELAQNLQSKVLQDYTEINDTGLNDDHYERVFDETHPTSHFDLRNADDSPSANNLSNWSVASDINWDSSTNVSENQENYYEELEMI